jgi:hypothetical protein
VLLERGITDADAADEDESFAFIKVLPGGTGTDAVAVSVDLFILISTSSYLGGVLLSCWVVADLCGGDLLLGLEPKNWLTLYPPGDVDLTLLSLSWLFFDLFLWKLILLLHPEIAAIS